MKTVIILFSTMLFAFSSTARNNNQNNGQGNKITDYKLKTILEMSVESPQYCNEIDTKLNYRRSGRAAFGPHYFDLEIIALTRKYCGQSGNVDISLDLETALQGKTGRIVIRSNDGSSIQFDH